MAEFQEVMKQKKRMCKSTMCSKCDIYLLSGKDLSRCQRFILNNPQKSEGIIMQWAAENPEPVYPTWHDFLYEKGVLRDKMVCGMPDMIATDVATDKVNDPIPADMAQRLGIAPKEG